MSGCSNIRTVLLVLLCIINVSACSNAGVFSISEPEKPQIELKENPSPRQAYRIEMRIENAPGPFAMIEGGANYHVQNHKGCGYINRKVGTVSRISTIPSIEWKRIGENHYETTMYADLMINENYYGRGVCRWEFTYASALLKATGAKEETRFLPGMTAEEIKAEKSVTWYFANLGYPASKTADFPDLGDQNINNYKPEIRNQLFSVTLISKGKQP